MVPPVGFEPTLPPPEGGALSPELRGGSLTRLAHAATRFGGGVPTAGRSRRTGERAAPFSRVAGEPPPCRGRVDGVRTPSLSPVRPVREHARTVRRIPSPRSPEPDVTARPRRRPIAATVLTVLAGSLVFVALVLPREVGQLSPGAFLRIPAEGLLGLALLLVLTGRRRRIAATVGGAALGVLTLLKVLQMGFLSVLGRPFDPVFDWSRWATGWR